MWPFKNLSQAPVADSFSQKSSDDVISVSLVSHTNVGKTSLVRALLRREVGEVRYGAHVTLFNESYTLLESGGFMLRLWDTPGFGDSARLLKRLKRESKPVLWFLSQTWDRLTDRPLWCAQQTLKNVRDESDVVLYLVNASEPPEVSGYIDHEMEILGWLAKPVVVVLNQLGPRGNSGLEAAELKSWRTHLQQFEIVRTVLPFDAFTHCWAEEEQLMGAIARALPESQSAAFAILRKEWHKRYSDTPLSMHDFPPPLENLVIHSPVDPTRAAASGTVPKLEVLHKDHADTSRGQGSSRNRHQILEDRSIPVPAEPSRTAASQNISKLEVFLCHANGDKKRVREIYRRLKSSGFLPWLDAENLDPGDNWKVEIAKAVKRSHVILVCLSKHSLNKEGYVQSEIRMALDVADEKPDGAIYIIPVKLEECDVPNRLNQWHWVNFFDEDGYGRLERSLRKRLTQIGQ